MFTEKEKNKLSQAVKNAKKAKKKAKRKKKIKKPVIDKSHRQSVSIRIGDYSGGKASGSVSHTPSQIFNPPPIASQYWSQLPTKSSPLDIAPTNNTNNSPTDMRVFRPQPQLLNGFTHSATTTRPQIANSLPENRFYTLTDQAGMNPPNVWNTPRLSSHSPPVILGETEHNRGVGIFSSANNSENETWFSARDGDSETDVSDVEMDNVRNRNRKKAMASQLTPHIERDEEDEPETSQKRTRKPYTKKTPEEKILMNEAAEGRTYRREVRELKKLEQQKREVEKKIEREAKGTKKWRDDSIASLTNYKPTKGIQHNFNK